MRTSSNGGKTTILRHFDTDASAVKTADAFLNVARKSQKQAMDEITFHIWNYPVGLTPKKVILYTRTRC